MRVVHCMASGETPRLTRLQTMYKVLKYDKNLFSGTGMDPENNRKSRQFIASMCSTVIQRDRLSVLKP